MKIHRADLCLRFYRRHGWTREDVRQLLREDQRLARVCPRYRGERDKLTKFTPNFEVPDDNPHDDCEYYAVYGTTDPFQSGEMENHEIIGGNHVAGSGF